MNILIVTLLALVCLGVVLFPLLAPRGHPFDDNDPAQELAEGLRRARDRVYEEIRALQQEYFLKSLSEQEYQAQLQEARTRAALLLRRQEQVQQTLADLDAGVEEELKRLTTEGQPDQPPEDRA